MPPSPLSLPALARLAGSPRPDSVLEFVTPPTRHLDDLGPQALAATYWLRVPDGIGPSRVDIRFTGRRADVTGSCTEGDEFVSTVVIPEVLPGSSPTAVTQRVEAIHAGRWSVSAEAVARPREADGGGPVWLLPPARGVGRTVYAPIARMRAPGVVLGSWPVLVLAGYVLALIVQTLLARAHALPPGRVLTLSLLAGALGSLGAKLYYHATHQGQRRVGGLAGLSVQGFVVTAITVFTVGGSLWGLPVGHVLDATIPALLSGQAVGRLGCLLAGCCSGRPTASRWGLWSSDRRIGTRRIPVQILESVIAATLALATGAVSWRASGLLPGGVFLGGLAAYVLARQLLFPLRELPRATRHGRTVVLVLASATLIASTLVLSLA